MQPSHEKSFTLLHANCVHTVADSPPVGPVRTTEAGSTTSTIPGSTSKKPARTALSEAVHLVQALAEFSDGESLLSPPAKRDSSMQRGGQHLPPQDRPCDDDRCDWETLIHTGLAVKDFSDGLADTWHGILSVWSHCGPRKPTMVQIAFGLKYLRAHMCLTVEGGAVSGGGAGGGDVVVEDGSGSGGSSTNPAAPGTCRISIAELGRPLGQLLGAFPSFTLEDIDKHYRTARTVFTGIQFQPFADGLLVLQKTDEGVLQKKRVEDLKNQVAQAVVLAQRDWVVDALNMLITVRMESKAITVS